MWYVHRIGNEDRAELIKVLKKGIDIYNRYRVPEAVGVIERVNGDCVTVEFSGYFCRTCGVIDWIEDYVYIVRDLGVDIEIVNVELVTEKEHILVRFRIKDIDKDMPDR